MNQVKKINFPKENNLELLRLIFALQVVISHMSSHMGFFIPDFASHFPGVPAFFFVSGLLIYSSYLNAPGKNILLTGFCAYFPDYSLSRQVVYYLYYLPKITPS